MLRQIKPTSSRPSGSHKKASKPRAQSPVVKLCSYAARVCTQPVLEKYDYCARHILEDKNAPFKPCGYNYPSNNKRCLLPAPRDKRETGYCTVHTWKSQMKRQGTTAKHVPPVTPESLLAGLAHYVRPIRSASKAEGEDNHSSSRTKPINPFVEADLTKAALGRSQVLECASDSDSDVDMATMENVWDGQNEDSSDAESVESQMDDSLKHAGAFSLEEVAAIHHKKLSRLQLLYQRQYERLAYIMKEKRRKYLIALKKEKETLSSIADQARTSAKDQKLYDKLKALNRYHRRSASESVAYLSQIEKRQKDLAKPPSYTKCFYSEGGVRCSKSTIPLTRYCFKHILEDPNQFLFRACGCEKADTICRDTVTGLCAGETCILHVKLPPLPHVNISTENSGSINRLESDADRTKMEESELDASATESAMSTDNRDSADDTGTRPADHSQSLRMRSPTTMISIKSDFPEDVEEGD
uniref:KAT8 regulatory NSL complex subunit 2 n=1 Tax=Lygus hesperus TaxID=30085 RepID=A0A0A9YZ64_LYGHE